MYMPTVHYCTYLLCLAILHTHLLTTLYIYTVHKIPCIHHCTYPVPILTVTIVETHCLYPLYTPTHLLSHPLYTPTVHTHCTYLLYKPRCTHPTVHTHCTYSLHIPTLYTYYTYSLLYIHTNCSACSSTLYLDACPLYSPYVRAG